MRIGVAHDRIAPGDGSSRYLQGLIARLCEQGHDVHGIDLDEAVGALPVGEGVEHDLGGRLAVVHLHRARELEVLVYLEILA